MTAAAGTSVATKPVRRLPVPRIASGTLLGYVLRRLVQAVPLLFLIVCLNFALIKMAPGDTVDLIAPEGADEAYRAAIRSKMGLDQPEYVQLANYISNVVRGDLGYSVRSHQYVLPLI